MRIADHRILPPRFQAIGVGSNATGEGRQWDDLSRYCNADLHGSTLLQQPCDITRTEPAAAKKNSTKADGYSEKADRNITMQRRVYGKTAMPLVSNKKRRRLIGTKNSTKAGKNSTGGNGNSTGANGNKARVGTNEKIKSAGRFIAGSLAEKLYIEHYGRPSGSSTPDVARDQKLWCYNTRKPDDPGFAFYTQLTQYERVVAAQVCQGEVPALLQALVRVAHSNSDSWLDYPGGPAPHPPSASLLMRQLLDARYLHCLGLGYRLALRGAAASLLSGPTATDKVPPVSPPPPRPPSPSPQPQLPRSQSRFQFSVRQDLTAEAKQGLQKLHESTEAIKQEIQTLRAEISNISEQAQRARGTELAKIRRELEKAVQALADRRMVHPTAAQEVEIWFQTEEKQVPEEQKESLQRALCGTFGQALGAVLGAILEDTIEMCIRFVVEITQPLPRVVRSGTALVTRLFLVLLKLGPAMLFGAQDGYEADMNQTLAETHSPPEHSRDRKDTQPVDQITGGPSYQEEPAWGGTSFRPDFRPDPWSADPTNYTTTTREPTFPVAGSRGADTDSREGKNVVIGTPVWMKEKVLLVEEENHQEQ